MISKLLISFTKGEWLDKLYHTYFQIKGLTFFISIPFLVGLTVLSIGTLLFLFFNAFGYQVESLVFIHSITKKVITDETAWAAFVIIVANITFMHRSRATEIQQEALNLQQKSFDLQKEIWEYEKKKTKKEI